DVRPDQLHMARPDHHRMRAQRGELRREDAARAPVPPRGGQPEGPERAMVAPHCFSPVKRPWNRGSGSPNFGPAAMSKPPDHSEFGRLIAELRACTACAAHLPFAPQPIFSVSPTARLALISQAPGVRADKAGKPFADPSGVRLREW